jgi:DNA-binding NtrC family response regulator
MKSSILVIEDDKLMRATLVDALITAGYEVISFGMGREALSAVKNDYFDVIVTDVRLPDIDGISVLREISKNSDTPVIVMTAFGTIKDAVEAMKHGAFDYITKPFLMDEFLILIERAIGLKYMRDENIRLKRELNNCYAFKNFIGESEPIRKLFSLIDQVSRSDATVLLLGESGTGKELIANIIHYQSTRKNKPFIKVNCAAIPENLIESELFGHEKGAFTGAIKKKAGKFELANGGTLFLDEIADLSLPSQVKLLRVVQERQFERVGGTETICVDVRLIAATNKNLEEEVKQSRFREDLYYRINVIPITLPPLRERKEDIPLLIDYFLKKYNNKLLKNVHFSKDAINILYQYHYPGNVRELENIIEHCVTLASTDIVGKDMLPSYIFQKGYQNNQLPLSAIIAETEKEYIIRILQYTGGNKTKASELLGISRKTLWEKITAYKIDL